MHRALVLLALAIFVPSIAHADPITGAVYLSLDYEGAAGIGTLTDGTIAIGTALPKGALFEIDDFVFNIEQTLQIGSQSSGAGAGKVNFNPVNITKPTDTATFGLAINAVVDKGGVSIPVFGYATFDAAPTEVPAADPILVPWLPADSCFQLGICQFSGVLVAYDAPVQVGSFEIVFVPNPVPEPASIWLFATALASSAVLIGLRRQMMRTNISLER